MRCREISTRLAVVFAAVTAALLVVIASAPSLLSLLAVFVIYSAAITVTLERRPLHEALGFVPGVPHARPAIQIAGVGRLDVHLAGCFGHAHSPRRARLMSSTVGNEIASRLAERAAVGAARDAVGLERDYDLTLVLRPAVDVVVAEVDARAATGARRSVYGGTPLDDGSRVLLRGRHHAPSSRVRLSARVSPGSVYAATGPAKLVISGVAASSRPSRS